MKKVFIAIIIGIIIVLMMFIVRSIIEETNNIESKLQLSNEEKNELNYSELIEDIECIENNKEIKHAKYVKEETNESFFHDSKYQGDGYYIISEGGVSDAFIYDIYTNKDNKIYESVKSTWSYNIERDASMKNIFYKIVAAVILVDICVCVVLFIKNKK